jgi:DNA-binding transcriptional LysR family regulator
MRIDILGLEAFLGIADRGSFNRAAAHLNLSQTALSHRMRKLEEDLGVKLLARTTRQVTLTPAGLELLPKARRIIGDLRAAFDELRGQGRATQEQLAIGCLPTVAIHYVPRLLAAFTRLYPALTVKVYDNSATEIADHVQAGRAEFGITIVSANRWDLDVAPLLKEPFVLACAADHPFARQKAVNWPDLQGIPLVRISSQTGNRMLIDDALGSRREAMTWRYEVQHVTTAVSIGGGRHRYGRGAAPGGGGLRPCGHRHRAAAQPQRLAHAGRGVAPRRAAIARRRRVPQARARAYADRDC